MTSSPTKFAASYCLLLLLVAGITNNTNAQQTLLGEEKTSSHDAEVMVTIAVPEGQTLSGTAIITLEDISLQDAPAVQLSTVSSDASSLLHTQSTIAVPVDLSQVSKRADVNVAVHIDSDKDGAISDGDWISDTIVNAITNDKMDVIVDIIQIGTQ